MRPDWRLSFDKEAVTQPVIIPKTAGQPKGCPAVLFYITCIG
jgi:hypothetical protein